MQPTPLDANLHRKLVFQNHAPHPHRKQNFDFFNFHDINISKQIEFVLFLSPSGIAFSPMTCAHLSLRAPLVKPLMHKNLAFLFECLFYDPLTSPLKWIFMILHENASCPRRGALFCFFALSRRGLEFTPKCISGAPFVDLAGDFPPNNIAPRCSRKHNFNFWAKTDEKFAFRFSPLPRSWKSMCKFCDFLIIFQKNASGLGAEHIFESQVHKFRCPNGSLVGPINAKCGPGCLLWLCLNYSQWSIWVKKIMPGGN